MPKEASTASIRLRREPVLPARAACSSSAQGAAGSSVPAMKGWNGTARSSVFVFPIASAEVEVVERVGAVVSWWVQMVVEVVVVVGGVSLQRLWARECRRSHVAEL